MSASRRRWLFALAGLVGLAFALRLARLDAVPLRGDEAFAVRYWAAAPGDAVRTLIRDEPEPHPIGTFAAFWAWKSLAGDSEFAMRMLPLLGNLLGVAAIAMLARRATGSRPAALIAAALWAIHPYLIWHAQDVRNYAIWAALSPLALWLFLRAVDRGDRRAWAAYVVVEALALYSFFLEAFLLVAQGLYLLLWRRDRPTLTRAARAWAALGALLIPWLAQLWVLSQSGYQGAVAEASAPDVLTWFLPTLLIGYAPASPWNTLLPLAWLGLIAALAWARRPLRLPWAWIALWGIVPVALLLVAATRMSVFHPRYVIPLIAPLIVLTAWALAALRRRTLVAALAAPLLAIPLLGTVQLATYYRGDDPKAPDWPALAQYFSAQAQSGDLIVQPAPDPAFGYYYHGPADETSLTPEADARALLQPEINFRPQIWTFDAPARVSDLLDAEMQRIDRRAVSGFRIAQYRPWAVREGEIATPTDLTFEDFARLAGYAIQGPDPVTGALTVLLYWEPLRQTETDYVVFVHLAGPGDPAGDTGPLVGQDDHRPRDGFASTLAWEPGALVRDVYRLAVPGSLAPGAYRLVIGFYPPDNPAARVPVAGPDGAPLGDSATLRAFAWPQP